MWSGLERFWSWLSQTQNSSAVQGIAAMMNVSVTVILAILTGWYVILTRRMALGQEEQVRSLIRNEEQTKQNAEHRLLMLVTRLQTFADQLPYKPADFNLLVHLTLWTERDLDDFQEAVINARGDAATLAGELIDSLRWLLVEQEKAKRDATSLADIDVYRYQNKVLTSKSKLSEIAGLANTKKGGTLK